MSAVEADLIVDQGEDYYAQFYWLDFNDVPVPLRGPAYMDIRGNGQYIVRLATPEAPDAAEDALNTILISESSGAVTVSIPQDVTSEIAPGQYTYDLFVYYPIFNNDGSEDTTNGPKRRRLVYGLVSVRAKVTQA